LKIYIYIYPKKRCFSTHQKITFSSKSYLIRLNRIVTVCSCKLPGGELSLEEDFALSPFPLAVESVFGDLPGVERVLSRVQTVDEWLARKDWREGRINMYLWNEGKTLYFDWDTVANVQMPCESVTAF